jgi:hypothetical protein
MGIYIANVDRLRSALGCHVMVVHHSGKDTTKGARGSVALRGAVDTEIELAAEGGVTSVTQRKQRDMPLGDPLAFSLRQIVVGQNGDGEDVTSAVLEPAEARLSKRVSGRPEVALQALTDALVAKGRKITSPDLPGCKVVEITHWRDMCDRHGLTDAGTEAAKKKAFQRAKDALLDKDLIRQFDAFVWKVNADG